MKIFELAQIETDEAENWHTLRLLVSLSVGQVSASYLSISSLKFHMNIEAQSSAAHRPSVPSATPKVKGYNEFKLNLLVLGRRNVDRSLAYHPRYPKPLL